MSPTVVIEARGLRYRYGDGTLALDGVDFVLHEGETVALFGPNGSGKTTFVLMLNGLLTGEGEITICGVRLDQRTVTDIRRKVGIVFQDSDVQLFMPTVLEDVAFGPMNQGLDRDRAFEEAGRALEQVGMANTGHRPPYHLSSGEKRRVALAGVLVMKPEILILDEPTTYLDPPGQRELLKLLKGLPQSKILVTHDPSFGQSLADRAVFFEKGRVAGAGPVCEVVRRFEWNSQPG